MKIHITNRSFFFSLFRVFLRSLHVLCKFLCKQFFEYLLTFMTDWCLESYPSTLLLHTGLKPAGAINGLLNPPTRYSSGSMLPSYTISDIILNKYSPFTLYQCSECSISNTHPRFDIYTNIYITR